MSWEQVAGLLSGVLLGALAVAVAWVVSKIF